MTSLDKLGIPSKKTLVRFLAAVVLASGAIPASLGLAPGTGEAQAQRKPQREAPKARTVQSVGSYEQRLMAATQEALEQGDEEAALEALRKLEGYAKRNEYETALMHQLFGHVHSAREEFDAAIASFEAAIATQALPAQAELNLRYNLGQLYVAVERYDEGIRTLEAWFAAVTNPALRGYVLLAHAFVSKGDYAKALQPIRTAVEKSEKPKEDWLRLLLAVQIELEQLEDAAGTLETLVAHFSSKVYWTQLSAVYATLGRDRASLNAMEMAYRLGFLSESTELVRMAELYLYNGIPYQAGLVLEKGFAEGKIEKDGRTWQLLADSWLSAKEYERALPPLKQAARLADDGEPSLRLGHVYVQSEDWENAAEALRAALDKGGLEKPSAAELLLGISLMNLGDDEAAEKAFKQASRDDASRKSARAWLAHLRRAE